MQPLTEKTIRSSFINASRQEAKKLTLPENFDSLDWDSLDYLGWRDPKMMQRGYLLHTDAETGPGATSWDDGVSWPLVVTEQWDYVPVEF